MGKPGRTATRLRGVCAMEFSELSRGDGTRLIAEAADMASSAASVNQANWETANNCGPGQVKLECSSCGAEGTGTCECGVPYFVSPRERAAEAIKANPEKSDRAIAAEIGVSDKTVGAARKTVTAEGSAVEPEKRI